MIAKAAPHRFETNRFDLKEHTMTMRNFLTPSVRSLLIACALLPVSAMSQEATTSSQGQNESTVEGTVVSSTRDTLVVKTDDNQFQLFTFDHDTVKPRPLPAGTRCSCLGLLGFGNSGGGKSRPALRQGMPTNSHDAMKLAVDKWPQGLKQ
jgi:hypothetical protein